MNSTICDTKMERPKGATDPEVILSIGMVHIALPLHDALDAARKVHTAKLFEKNFQGHYVPAVGGVSIDFTPTVINAIQTPKAPND